MTSSQRPCADRRVRPLSRREVIGAVAATGLAAIGLALPLPALAQAWPAKPVTLVVPWPAGGPSDIAARPLAKGLQDTLGKAFVIDNRGGSGGNIGTALVVQAPADGYMGLVTSSAPIVINPSLYKKMPFDPSKDLIPVTNVMKVPQVLVVSPSAGVQDLPGLLAQIKAKPGYVFASSGNGTPQHLTGELFADALKAQMTHVPYKGSAPAISDLMAGHVPMLFDSLSSILPHIKSGKVKAIAIAGAKRSPLLPQVPTLAEAGLPGIESYGWYGLFVKAGTPQPIVQQLSEAALKVLKAPEFQKVLADTGSEYVGDSPANFAQFVKAEQEKWSRLVKLSGATID